MVYLLFSKVNYSCRFSTFKMFFFFSYVLWQIQSNKLRTYQIILVETAITDLYDRFRQHNRLFLFSAKYESIMKSDITNIVQCQNRMYINIRFPFHRLLLIINTDAINDFEDTYQ
jgi:hypothetical protein